MSCIRFSALFAVLSVFTFNIATLTRAQEEQAVTVPNGTSPAEAPQQKKDAEQEQDDEQKKDAEQEQDAEGEPNTGANTADTDEAATKPKKQKKPAPSKPAPLNGINYVNDGQIMLYAESQMNRMIKAEEAFTCTALESQAENRNCQVSLTKPNTEPASSVALYRKASQSIVAILISRKHLDHWHVVPAATGFFISDDGVIATNRHVFNKSDEYMFAMTSDYVVHPIKEVLGSNTANDLAYCRIETEGYRGLAFRKDIPVGATVSLISHPSGRFYTYSRGIVTRRYIRPPQRGPGTKPEDGTPAREPVKVPTRWISVSSEFGKGSSGGPVFDRLGNVVGMATSTNSLRVGDKSDKVSQMVFRDCVPAAVMLESLKRNTSAPE